MDESNSSNDKGNNGPGNNDNDPTQGNQKNENQNVAEPTGDKSLSDDTSRESVNQVRTTVSPVRRISFTSSPQTGSSMIRSLLTGSKRPSTSTEGHPGPAKAPQKGLASTFSPRCSSMSQPGPSSMSQPGPSSMSQPGPSSMSQPGPSSMSQPGPSSMSQQGPSSMATVNALMGAPIHIDMNMLQHRHMEIEEQHMKENVLDGASSPYSSQQSTNRKDVSPNILVSSPFSYSYPEMTIGIANHVPAQNPEWKRYMQYSCENLKYAVQAVVDGNMMVQQAAEKYNVSYAILYDNVYKHMNEANDSESPYSDKQSTLEEDVKPNISISSPVTHSHSEMTLGLANHVPAQKPERQRCKKYSREDLNCATQAVVDGKLSIRKAAKENNVPFQTLRSNVNKLDLTSTYSFKDLNSAIQAVVHGKMPIRQAVEEYNVPYMTLHSNVKKLDITSRYSFKDLNWAIQAVVDGKMSIRKAAKEKKVPFETLRSKVNKLDVTSAYSFKDPNCATQAVVDGKMSIRKAAKEKNVPYETLRSKVNKLDVTSVYSFKDPNCATQAVVDGKMSIRQAAKENNVSYKTLNENFKKLSIDKSCASKRYLN